MPELGAIVSETGPLIALIACEHLDLLRQVAERVVVPVEVDRELRAGGRFAFGVDEYAACSWLEPLDEPRVIPQYLSAVLDSGEAAVIQAARDLGIGRVLIDEWSGRRWARTVGLAVTGSLGVLMAARRLGAAVSIREAAHRMVRQGIRLSPALVAEAIRLGGE